VWSIQVTRQLPVCVQLQYTDRMWPGWKMVRWAHVQPRGGLEVALENTAIDTCRAVTQETPYACNLWKFGTGGTQLT
jgi:hypothetical protein